MINDSECCFVHNKIHLDTLHFHCIMLCKEELNVYFDVLIKCVAVNECETCLTEILPPSVHKENTNSIYTGDN